MQHNDEILILYLPTLFRPPPIPLPLPHPQTHAPCHILTVRHDDHLPHNLQLSRSLLPCHDPQRHDRSVQFRAVAGLGFRLGEQSSAVVWVVGAEVHGEGGGGGGVGTVVGVAAAVDGEDEGGHLWAEVAAGEGEGEEPGEGPLRAVFYEDVRCEGGDAVAGRFRGVEGAAGDGHAGGIELYCVFGWKDAWI